MTPTVWTPRRRWLGNLVPLAVWSPFALAGFAWIALRPRDILPGVLLLVAATVFGWICLNRFGLFENERMMGQLDRILSARGDAPAGERWFVGFASPKFRALVDAHEDVGYLYFEPDRLVFMSETRIVEIPREDVKDARFRANVHSLVGLGRWVAVEGTIRGRPIRLNVEPREKPTLLGNRATGPILLRVVIDWLREGQPKPGQ